MLGYAKLYRDRIRAEGIEIGKAQGLEQGKAEGKARRQQAGVPRDR